MTKTAGLIADLELLEKRKHYDKRIYAVLYKR